MFYQINCLLFILLMKENIYFLHFIILLQK